MWNLKCMVLPVTDVASKKTKSSHTGKTFSKFTTQDSNTWNTTR
jgi:hypothetical protein